MYNGIGLQTARGSGTNGYVQANKFFVRPRPQKTEQKDFKEGQGTGGVLRKANSELLEHDRKRQIELKVVLLEETLEEQGYTEEEILVRVSQLRQELETSAEQDPDQEIERKNVQESHHISARKEKELEKMKSALGIGDVKEGEAFDRELQEQRRQERIEAREKAEVEKLQKQLDLEKEQRRKEKEARKQQKREMKELKRRDEEKREWDEGERRAEKRKRKEEDRRERDKR
eukprot:TRINITY_DN22988_c0_g1_i1.p1 TRINITY_DN22988_c0_g1~~TRINITY_DN22988_c0_g1_i1.p1  ORF type:complete len:231 (-),score=94.33 TRINITY_DN22988_c0_g1_i1:415-1107(-)